MFTWHRGDFRAGVSSLRFSLMALHLFTWYHYKMSCQRESLQYEISQRCHVNAKRANVSVWNRTAGRLERVAHAIYASYHLLEVSAKNLLTSSHSTKKYLWEEKGKERKIKQNKIIRLSTPYILFKTRQHLFSSYKMISEPNVTEV